VPVRREKIVIEQVAPTYVQIAEVDLGDVDLLEREIQDKYKSEILKLVRNNDESISKANSKVKRVVGNFDSLEDAHDFLNSVFLESSVFEREIHIEVVSKNM
jgi:hypothetical protein